MTVHLVTEELRKRGRKVEHIHSWDDYDRLRKVPAGCPAEFADYLGRPICDVPDPRGEYASFAERNIVEFETSSAALGIHPRYIRQSLAYRSGAYVAGIERAMQARLQIFDILAEYQTKADDADPIEDRRQSYYPFKLYCEGCNRDTTRILTYDEATAAGSYECQTCQHRGEFRLRERVFGKLVWKVDWPMRWSYEGVDFEPGGEDHSSPGSSYTVGKRIVAEVFNDVPPMYVGYGFVGAGGRTKISSSAGTSVTPGVALRIIEPAILRWLYTRRHYRDKFNIEFGQEVLRLYDEWDSLTKRVEKGAASGLDAEIYHRSVRTTTEELPRTPFPLPFRLLSSLTDVTLGKVQEILRILTAQYGDELPAGDLRAALEPRLSNAICWATEYVPDDERTIVKPSFDAEVYASLTDQDRASLALLLEGLEANWTFADLTALLYGVPKRLLGLPLDTPPTDELKATQRRFFITLYQLLVGSDTGPRLPTLFLALGPERVRALLSPPTG
jgi:lysyl-tRNA synthetase class 1